MDYSLYNHNKDLTDVFASFEEGEIGVNYIYILPNYGNWHNSNKAAITEMFPIISVYQIFVRIASDVGYTMQAAGSDVAFNDYIADFSNILIGESAISKNKFAELNQAFTADGNIVTTGSPITKYVTPNGFDDSADYLLQIEETGAITDPQQIVSSGVVTIPTPGAYDFRLKYAGSFSIERNAGLDDFEILSSVIYKVQIKKNGTLINENTAEVVPTGFYSDILPAEIFSIETNTKLTHLVEGDEIEFLYQFKEG